MNWKLLLNVVDTEPHTQFDLLAQKQYTELTLASSEIETAL